MDRNNWRCYRALLSSIAVYVLGPLPNDLVLDGSTLYVADGNNVWRISPIRRP